MPLQFSAKDLRKGIKRSIGIRMKKATLAIGSLELMLTLMALLSFNAEARVEQWVPYVPFEKQVELAFWMKDEVAYINVTITFYSGGFEIRNWGLIIKEGHELWADSEIWRWTGPVILVVWKITHTYNLGYLKNGKYTFTFRAWGYDVKSIEFIVTGWLKRGSSPY